MRGGRGSRSPAFPWRFPGAGVKGLRKRSTLSMTLDRNMTRNPAGLRTGGHTPSSASKARSPPSCGARVCRRFGSTICATRLGDANELWSFGPRQPHSRGSLLGIGLSVATRSQIFFAEGMMSVSKLPNSGPPHVDSALLLDRPPVSRRLCPAWPRDALPSPYESSGSRNKGTHNRVIHQHGLGGLAVRAPPRAPRCRAPLP